MKKFLIIISLLFSANYICVAQTQSSENSGTAEDVTIAYMTKELGLSPEESKQFWPVYKNYHSEIKKAKNDFGTDEVAFEEKKVAIRKKYQHQFKGVLNSDKRVNRVFVSEKNLRDLFKKELQDRQRRKKFPGMQQQRPQKPGGAGIKSRKPN